MTNDLAALSEAALKAAAVIGESYTRLQIDKMERTQRQFERALVNEYRAGRLVPNAQLTEATARAEAAEARNKVLEEALRQIRALTAVHRTHVTRAVYRISLEALGCEHE